MILFIGLETHVINIENMQIPEILLQNLKFSACLMETSSFEEIFKKM
jgi:hypothetical protein